MTFLNPLGLIGLLSLPVILALHLLRKRQRPIIVSHIGLWSFLDRETRGPRRQRLPITWLLLLDLLIALLFSLAWAQPLLALDLPLQPARHLVILLDVSTSMRAEDGARFGQDRFEQAQAEIMELLDSAGPRDTITLISFGSQAALVADSRQDGEVLRQRLLALQPGETGSALRAALALGHAALEPDLPAAFHIFSDGSFPEESLSTDSSLPHNNFAYPLHWHPVGRQSENQAVIALNAAPLRGGTPDGLPALTGGSPDGAVDNSPDQYQVFARIANFGSRRSVREVRLEVNGRTVDQQFVDLPADSSLPQVWQVSAGAGRTAPSVTVTLLGEDVLAADDSAAIGLQASGTTRVALVADDPALIAQAVQAAPGVNLTVIPPAEYAAARPGQIPAYDLTIFRGYLPERWPAGQVLLVEPPSSNPPQAAPGMAAPELAGAFTSVTGSAVPANSPLRAPVASPLLEGIDFSGVRWTRALRLAGLPEGFVPLLQAGDTPLLLQGELRSSPGATSRVVILLADLAQGNFTQHPAFPILLANLAERSRQAPLQASFLTGEAVPLPPAGIYQEIAITPPQAEPLTLEAEIPAAWRGTLDPGLYHFRFTTADGAVTEFVAGVRAGDEVESDLRPRAWVQAAENAALAAGAGQPEPADPLDLRPWLLGAAILFLLMEASLAWRSSR